MHRVGRQAARGRRRGVRRALTSRGSGSGIQAATRRRMTSPDKAHTVTGVLSSRTARGTHHRGVHPERRASHAPDAGNLHGGPAAGCPGALGLAGSGVLMSPVDPGPTPPSQGRTASVRLRRRRGRSSSRCRSSSPGRCRPTAGCRWRSGRPAGCGPPICRTWRSRRSRSRRGQSTAARQGATAHRPLCTTPRTARAGSRTTRSAAAPGTIRPRSGRPTTSAGTSEAALTASSSGRPASRCM